MNLLGHQIRESPSDESEPDIKFGTILSVRIVSGTQEEKMRVRAIGRPTTSCGEDVVWVCTEEKFERCRQSGEKPDGIPWPLDLIKSRRPSAPRPPHSQGLNGS